MDINWVALLGDFQIEHDEVLFKGGFFEGDEGQRQLKVGNLLSDVYFGGGSISASVEFLGEVTGQGLEFIIFYDPLSQYFLTAGIGQGFLTIVRGFSAVTAQGSRLFGGNGNRAQIVPDRKYILRVVARGSRVSVSLDGVEVLSVDLGFPFPSSQVGLWGIGAHDIKVTDFEVEREQSTAFVVMQFSSPYNELYEDVIKPICENAGYQVERADETYRPGLIIRDIERKISQGSLIIAEISPPNLNVYYELGYAHALNKPTIIIADAGTDLPFDVSPFRVLFYENSIAGKARIEQDLRNHLKAIRGIQPAP